MARMKFLCDAERCIECNACVTACKNEHEVPWGINRRRVVTINDGKPGERSISVACMHCSDAPCIAVCPVDCIYETEEGVVLHSKDLCIGCGYCFYACPFGAPQVPGEVWSMSQPKFQLCWFAPPTVKSVCDWATTPVGVLEMALKTEFAAVVLQSGALSTHDIVVDQAAEGFWGFVPNWN